MRASGYERTPARKAPLYFMDGQSSLGGTLARKVPSILRVDDQVAAGTGILQAQRDAIALVEKRRGRTVKKSKASQLEYLEDIRGW